MLNSVTYTAFISISLLGLLIFVSFQWGALKIKADLELKEEKVKFNQQLSQSAKDKKQLRDNVFRLKSRNENLERSILFLAQEGIFTDPAAKKDSEKGILPDYHKKVLILVILFNTFIFK